MQVSRKSLFNTLIVLTILLLLVTFKLPYYIYKPGEVNALTDMVEVDAARKSEGNFYLVTVTSLEATPLQFIFAKLANFTEIIPTKHIKPKNMTNEQYREYQMLIMKNSQDASQIVSFEAAGKDVKVVKDGIFILRSMEGMPAEGKVESGDEIIRVDNQSFTETEQLINYIQTKRVGETIVLTLLRQGQLIEEEIEVAFLPANKEQLGIGIHLVNTLEVETTPALTIESGRIGGPSAGLMFALEIYNQLVEEDITKGYEIAGTGEISSTGIVSRVGSVDKKVVAADRQGIDIFFVPYEDGVEESNYDLAVRTAREIKSEMKIVPIDTFEEALSYLEQLEPKNR